jgi:hypothetical protein
MSGMILALAPHDGPIVSGYLGLPTVMSYQR